jgi:hypothetical protein
LGKSLTEKSTMRRSQRLIAAAVLIVFSTVLAGCSSSFGSDFDPTDLLDWLDTKKKLPGKREPVFPDGVPGMEQGVPKDMYKGAQQDDPNTQAIVAPSPQPQVAQQPRVAQQPLEPPPGSPQAVKRAKAKAKEQAKEQAKSQSAAAPAAAEPDGEAAAASQGDGTQATPPAPKKKIVRRRTTAPPPDSNPQAAAPQSGQPAQASQEAFPAPLPGGQFSR